MEGGILEAYEWMGPGVKKGLATWSEGLAIDHRQHHLRRFLLLGPI